MKTKPKGKARRGFLTVELQSLPGKPFRAAVLILEERRAYGRTDLRIAPQYGDGEAWVRSTSVEEVK